MTLKHWLWLAALAALLLCLVLLQPILLPFVIASALAYLGDPIVDWLQRHRLSRSMGVVVVFVGLTVINLLGLLLVLPMLQDQIMLFLSNLPGYLQWMYGLVQPWLGPLVPEDPSFDAEGLRKVISDHVNEAGGVLTALWSTLSQPGMMIIALIGNLVLVPVLTFYLLRDWDRLVAHIRDLLPRRILPKVTEIAVETDTVLSAFIRGQLLVMLALGILYSFGLWLAGLDFALLIGMAAGLVSFVPYLGFIVGLLSASIAILVQTQELMPLLWVLAVFGVGQVLESSILTPLLVGDRIGLHPVAVIFAVLAGGQLFGFMGVMLALPVAAVAAVLLRHAKQHWLQTELYLKDG
ncbi:MAG: AI-2E family transporter [Salinisphaeraceae bacterium]|nr:AI-2E family transporter [Salinisphaeraceae bacterium]